MTLSITIRAQILDLEHASLHLSCTVVPVHAPLPSLRQLQKFTDDPFHRLTVRLQVDIDKYFINNCLKDHDAYRLESFCRPWLANDMVGNNVNSKSIGAITDSQFR